ncbi:hypothetical protein SAMN06265348_110276 [Pedobacter westerhofensis]|uniref:Uncharacterized protein n=2 Tax=Pedobacter westerhofensis TaxID=425512 RepID=A0A521F9M1_9SPHI|nr:hypothetical protein SAMN06265348_110276 [Pedobacter westerhofensis]
MKRKFTLVALLLPTATFAQSSTSSKLFYSLMGFGIVILVFLVLREVVMWYWKVNTIIDNQVKLIRTQQETNNLLTEQITLMKGYYQPDSINSPERTPTKEE